MDGIALLEHLDTPGSAASDGVGAVGPDVDALADLADRLRAWFADLIDQPEAGDDAWLPSRLEYGFAVSAPEIVLRAEEYHHGNLDWWALDRDDGPGLGDPPQPAVPVDRRVQTFIPTSVVFDGMPSTRWWQFEDRRTNFGQVSPDTTDIGKLLLMEFALVFANDWFVLPWTLPVGTMASVRGVAVTTVFDERLWVTPVQDQTPAEDWNRWSMFTLSDADGGDPVPELLLLATAPKVQEGEALEDVSLVRDEMANMVWAVEHQVPLPTGWRRSGAEAAFEYRAHLQRLADAGGGPPAAPPPPAAPVRYQVMNDVPEQWIPFIPVHVENSTRETQLQRAAMPRFLDGGPPVPDEGAATNAVAAPRPAARLLRARGGGAAGRRLGEPVLPTDAPIRRGSGRLVRRPQTHGPRRGVERAGVRPLGRLARRLSPRPSCRKSACLPAGDNRRLGSVKSAHPDRLAVLAAAITVLLWASAFVVIRFCGAEFSPGAMAFIRMGVGTIALTAVVAIYRPPWPRGRGLVLVIGYGLLWFAAYTVVLNWAEQHLDAGTAALLVNFAPILVAVFAGLFLGEGFPRPLVVGLVIAFTGVVLIALGGSGVGMNDRLGVALGLLAAVLYAAGVLLQKVALRTVNAIAATWLGCAVGMVATAPFAVQAVDEIARPRPPRWPGSSFWASGRRR